MKHDVRFWWIQKVTSICMIPVTLYLLLFSFFCVDIVPLYELGAVPGMNSPSVAFMTELISKNPFLIILFMLFSLYHGALGMQVVMEDYISCVILRNILITVLYVVSGLTALAGLFIVCSLF